MTAAPACSSATRSSSMSERTRRSPMFPASRRPSRSHHIEALELDYLPPASDRARRRLCRSRIGASLPSLRQPRDGYRAGAAAHGPRGSRRRRRNAADPRATKGSSFSWRPRSSTCMADPERNVSLVVRTASGERTIEGSDILVAAGRVPNTRRDRARGGRRRAGRSRLYSRQRAAGDERARRVGDRRMRRQPAVHARVGGRLSDHQGQSGRRKAQHARSAGSLLRVHGPSARPRRTERRRSATPERHRSGREAADERCAADRRRRTKSKAS